MNTRNTHELASASTPARGRSRRVATGLLLMLLVPLAGCDAVNKLRSAQDAFNVAAMRENTARYAEAAATTNVRTTPEHAADATMSRFVGSGYQLARERLAQISPSDEQSLKGDKLLGTKLALEALTLWKLGDRAGSDAAAQRARNEAGNQLFPRDAIMMDALPGLRMIEQAQADAAKLQRATTPDSPGLVKIEHSLLGAVANDTNHAMAFLNKADDQARQSFPEMRPYLLQCKLSAYVVLQRAYIKAFAGEGDRRFQNSHDANVKPLLNQLAELTDGKDGLAKLWGNKLGITSF